MCYGGCSLAKKTPQWGGALRIAKIRLRGRTTDVGYYSARHEPGGNQVSLGDSVATAEREALRCARRQEGQVAAEHRQQRRPGSTRACVEGTRGLAWAIVAPGGAQIWLLTC